MSTYVVVTLRLHDKAWMRAYNEKVPEIVRSYGGEYIAIGREVVAIEGDETPPDRIAILKYPSLEALQACMSSPEYPPHRQSRLGPADATILAFDAME